VAALRIIVGGGGRSGGQWLVSFLERSEG